jgi:beta-glucosidase
MNSQTLQELLKQLTLNEKAALCGGRDFWQLKGVARLGLPSIMVSDGPHGLRKQVDESDHLGTNGSVPATCFPPACATASSFDRTLLRAIGEAMAEEALQEQVSVILGPGVNIKRSPLCGRNFEYFSEDPLVAGELATALIEGIQSKGVGTSLKHFAANSQERARLSNDSVVDERALREIYLAAFERAVKRAAPWTLMCSYNLLNGVYASEHHRLLTEILRDEWGLKGLVMSDWGATANRSAGVAAGLDLEMPGSGAYNERQVVKAVKRGALKRSDLDASVLRVLEIIARSAETREAHRAFRYDVDAHHALARSAAAQSAVLLKNSECVLPLTREPIALIGAFAKTPRYQGAGSSKIVPTRLDNAFDALVAAGFDVEYAAGYVLKDFVSVANSEVPDKQREAPDDPQRETALIEQAALLASGKDVALVFAGLPDEYESEGYDRENMDMPETHTRLIEAVAAVNPNTVVVLLTGAPVLMPWAPRVKAILLAYLGGQAGGSGIVDVLTGVVNPGGKLAETWPRALADTPCAPYYPGRDKTAEYRESIFVGYRYYDTAQQEAAYPFGFGLSYTSFAYSNLTLDKDVFDGNGQHGALNATLTVTNSGERDGAEVVQLYVRPPASTLFRAAKELRGFEKVFLKAGESKAVSFVLDERAFAYYNVPASCWAIEGGVYTLLLGASSRDIRLQADISVSGDGKEAALAFLKEAAPDYFGLSSTCVSGRPVIGDSSFAALLGRPIPLSCRDPASRFTPDSTLGDTQGTFLGDLLWKLIRAELTRRYGASSSSRRFVEQMLFEQPLRSSHMSVKGFTPGKAAMLVKLLNSPLGRRR